MLTDLTCVDGLVDVDNPGHGIRNEDRGPKEMAGYNRRTGKPITIEQYETKRRRALAPLP